MGMFSETLRPYQYTVNDSILITVKARDLTEARMELELSPVEMARAMGVSYETFNGWESGRRSMPAVAVRCVELLLLYPKTARRFGVRTKNRRVPSGS